MADFTATLTRVIAAGDLVAVQAMLTGTAPSAGRTQTKMPEFFRLEHGRIAERWS